MLHVDCCTDRWPVENRLVTKWVASQLLSAILRVEEPFLFLTANNNLQLAEHEHRAFERMDDSNELYANIDHPDTSFIEQLAVILGWLVDSAHNARLCSYEAVRFVQKPKSCSEGIKRVFL